MVKIYGWTPVRTPDYPGGKSFDVGMIGHREYHRKMSAVSRPLVRLCQRELMERGPFGAGHCLAEMGRAYVDGNG